MFPHGSWHLQALLGHLVVLVDGHVRPGRGPLQIQFNLLLHQLVYVSQCKKASNKVAGLVLIF